MNRFSSAKTESFQSTPIQNIPSDTISDISINQDMIAISSWDGCVRVYRKVKSYNVSVDPFKLFENLGAPVLSVCLINDNFVVAGLADGQICLLNCQDGSVNKTKAHEQAVKAIRLFKGEFILTVSFDGFYKVFDPSFKEVHAVNLNSKIYCMEAIDGHMVMGLENKKVVYVDLNTQQTKEFQVPFEYAIRSIACLPTAYGVEVAVGAVEGKLYVFNTSSTAQGLTLRVHRADDKLFAINRIKFISNNVVLSMGSDGFAIFTNKNTKLKVASSRYDVPITAMDISGKDLVFAIGDDWSKGFQQNPLKTEMFISDLGKISGIF